MLVLCVLYENEATRFNSIGRALPDISPKVLTETLKNLEAGELIILPDFQTDTIMAV